MAACAGGPAASMDTGRSDETADTVIPTKHMALSARSVDMVDIALSAGNSPDRREEGQNSTVFIPYPALAVTHEAGDSEREGTVSPRFFDKLLARPYNQRLRLRRLDD